MKSKNAAPGQEAAPSKNNHSNATNADRRIGSRQVDWWSVHLFVAPLLERIESWPIAGTPEWAALADDDPAKLAAVLDGGRHWALRVDAYQDALADASKAIAAAADWKSWRPRGESYIERRKAS